ncbi:ubiquitin carboxyl-terminal hydrolase 12-like [Punica granatum]|uniref:Ubiquitin carboxyl-terminal hydrolase 12-like n=1 Tax=Punica granatum TaxID=22663 RepID=A0A6P8CIM2_PUNGR|nr:ubiquitin carboxyl-terminal hydrolase 12-like [Punica granatum]
MDNPSYKIIRVARDQDLIEQIGRDIYFDVVDHDRVRTFHVLKQTPFKLFKEEIAEVFGIPVQFQRFWTFANRQNHTYRPRKPLTPEEESKPVGELKEISKKAEEKELKLFLEVELGLHRRPVAPPVKSTEDILLFFKLYDPEKGELRYVGRLFVNSYAKPYDILGKVNEMAGFGPNEEVDLYEEIKFVPFVMCELIDRAASFRTNQLEDGDIICFQKRFVGAAESCRYLTVPSFLEHIRGLQETVRFVSYFNSLDEFIGAAEISGSGEGPSSGTQTSHILPRAPSSEEVENAKQSLKECLSDLFKLNMKDRLASALSTLSIAETGLSDEQRSSVLEFRVNFDNFITDYLTFEQDNSEYELLKLQSDLLSSAMKKNRETHLSYKELSEKLAREKEELKKKLEETKSRNAKLISDWEALMAESKETKSKYISQKPKLAEAEERKRIAEERMSRSTAAWSSLKARFL